MEKYAKFLKSYSLDVTNNYYIFQINIFATNVDAQMNVTSYWKFKGFHVVELFLIPIFMFKCVNQ
jgi:hypothetical protein